MALTLLGALPFVCIGTYVAMVDKPSANALPLLFAYAAIVLSFLSGIHWGIGVSHAQSRHSEVARIMYMESTGITLLAWLILMLPEPYIKLLAFALLYAVAWGIDSVLHSMRLIPLWYFTLRGIATPIVVVSLYVAYFSII